MIKVRIAIFLSTVLVVGVLAVFASYYARGYRFDVAKLKFLPNGLLVINSDPTGASILINGDLKSATNATIPLPPGIYDVEVKKEGYLTWSKRLSIEREIVTSTEVELFAAAPSLSAVTFAAAESPQISPDLTKIAYGLPISHENGDKAGLWLTEVSTLPIGFNREPRRITDGDLTGATWEWSPDAAEILLTTGTGMYLLDVNTFTPQGQRVNVSAQKKEIAKDWEEKKVKRLESQLAKLPDELTEFFEDNTTEIAFSPDEDKILYTATDSATLKEGLIKPLPGSSTQKQVRDIKVGKKYVFDIKEDRNFEVAEESQLIYWFPTSNHLVMPEEGRVVIADYDGTNRQVVYSGSYVYPHAYPYSNKSRLLILTNLGAAEAPANLYSLSLK